MTNDTEIAVLTAPPTLFTGGTIWTGRGDTDAVLVDGGVVVALGDEARRRGGAHHV
nr:amidohydrolase [Klebsiella pneumoniae]